MKYIKLEYILLLICCLVGGAIAYSIILYFGSDLSWWYIALRLSEGVLLMFLAIFLQIILHETGHMIAGLVRGWKFTSFMIMGWVLTRREGHFHFTRFNIPDAGGQCLMQPPHEGDTDAGIAFYNAGGVLMNAVISLLSVVMLTLGYASMPWDIAIFLAELALIGINFALINGIPAVINGLPNDGKNIQQLRKDSFSTQVFLSTMHLMRRLQQGESIDQIAPSYLCERQKLNYTNPIHQAAISFDISLAMARLDFDGAHTLFDEIDAHQSEIVDIYRLELTLEKVYLYLVSPRNNKDVNEFLDKDFLIYMDAQCVFRPTALRTKYAYTLLHEHDDSKAMELHQQFEKICKTYHMPGEVKTEQRLVDYAQALAQKTYEAKTSSITSSIQAMN